MDEKAVPTCKILSLKVRFEGIAAEQGVSPLCLHEGMASVSHYLLRGLIQGRRDELGIPLNTNTVPDLPILRETAGAEDIEFVDAAREAPVGYEPIEVPVEFVGDWAGVVQKAYMSLLYKLLEETPEWIWVAEEDLQIWELQIHFGDRDTDTLEATLVFCNMEFAALFKLSELGESPFQKTLVGKPVRDLLE